MSSAFSRRDTFDEGFELWLLAFSDDGFFSGNLLNKFINIGSACWVIYYEERFRRSMDLVSTSPLLRMYSRRMPGG
jgi:hypothetical protein